MKKNTNLNKQFILAIVITLSFTLAGYFYNQKLPNSWYLKYSISLTDSSKVQVIALDKFDAQYAFFDTKVNLRPFIEHKLEIQDLTIQTPNLENLAISTNRISFTKRNSLKDLDENLKNLIKNINDNLRHEITDYFNTIEETNNEIMALSRALKIQDLKFSLKFYRETSAAIPYSDEAVKLAQYLLTRLEKNSQQKEGVIFDKLLSVVTGLGATNSTKLLELELEKLKSQGSEEMAQFQRLKLLSKKIINTDIIELDGKIEQIEQKPKLYVSMISFAFFGLSLSALILMISLFSKKIKIKKLII